MSRTKKDTIPATSWIGPAARRNLLPCSICGALRGEPCRGAIVEVAETAQESRDAMSKHTPGPWHITDGPDPEVHGPNGEWITAQVVSGATDNEDDGRPNALLIAAAPDLLEALREMLDGEEIGEAECQRTGFPRLMDRWKNARAAIEKAEGRRTP